ncbi:MAG: hypothetical protein IKW71_00185, partial [Elusimicrobiaceae bacterium]|nr:hypothetical protein [Elusimicrobiaceae bacterium]
KRVAQLRAQVPQIGIFADVIAGYPTETEADFEQTCAFIRTQQLAGLHVFSYSARPGTPAAKLTQLPAEEIKRRADKLRLLDKQLRADFAAGMVGTEQTVFVEEKREGVLRAITSNFQPVLLPAVAAVHGLVRVKIERAQAGLCYATLL